MDGKMEGWREGGRNGWINEVMEGWREVGRNGWMDEQMDGWMDKWMDGEVGRMGRIEGQRRKGDKKGGESNKHNK